ncbi:MAG: ABC transporter permease [Pseudomonadota bacterium]|uniref:ABC transporter permease n=1 Tax=Roseibium sp. TaxID=1936156 RepID=UPI0031B13BD4
MFHFMSIRLTRALVTMFLVLVIAFVTLRLSGTPFEVMYPEGITAEHLEALEAKYGLDRPWPEQFVSYLGNVAEGNFGRSLYTSEHVWKMFADRMPYTIIVGGLALLLAIAVGIPLGAFSALYRSSPASRAGMGFAFLGYAVPHFVIGIALILFFGYYLRVLPTTGLETPRHYILPVVTLAIPIIAAIARFMRAAMLDAIGHAYVNTAVSKGLTDGQVARGHILRNAMIPLITVLGLEIAGLLNGTIFVEAVFSLPGVGRVLVDAVEGRDFPVLQFGLIAYAGIVVLVNLLIDFCYIAADPRIRVEA